MRLILGAALLAATLQLASAADLVGRITFKGIAPAPRLMTLDKVCSALAKTNQIAIPEYSLGVSNALSDVVVFVRETAPGAGARPDAVTLEKKNCRYTPYVAAVQVNQPVLIRNSDEVMHNIRLRRTDAGNPGVNFVQYARAADMKHAFVKPEPFLEIQSDYQAGLSAYVYVVNTPHFTITGKDGAYKLTGLPDGNYTLVAHHRLGGLQEKTVTLATKNATNDFVFPK